MSTLSGWNLPEDSLHPHWDSWPRLIEGALSLTAFVVAVCEFGFLRELTSFDEIVIYVAAAAALLLLLPRYQWSRTRATFAREHRFSIGASVIWVFGCLALFAASGVSWGTVEGPSGSVFRWTLAVAVARGLFELLVVIRGVARAGLNPAIVLAGSFVVLIAVGTLLLMMPVCRPLGEPAAPWRVALFTATSASCVTGLAVQDTGTYWSAEGQAVILGLIQLGGLGIMTFGAFFGLVAGRNLPMRERRTIRDLLDSDKLGDVNGLIRAILGFTLAIELAGAACLWSVWPDCHWTERLWLSLFHSISAFCNAGFSLLPTGLVGLELHWQVWGAIPALIILGGFGFMPLNNLRSVLWQNFALRWQPWNTAPGPRQRLNLSTKLVAVSTLALLVGGTLMIGLLEFNNPAQPNGHWNQFSNAWFHSVTLRTAGFNTVDHANLRPATKLFGVAMMFIGASPGSTGGGVKTICFALTVLALRSVLRDRHGVEAFGRSIPADQIFRALTIIVLSLLTVMMGTLLIVVIENHETRFLDQLYEATSAFGTVGLSSINTPTLQPGSQLVLVGLMFLGRIGPLTLMIALAGRSSAADYRYPDERVTLG